MRASERAREREMEKQKFCSKKRVERERALVESSLLQTTTFIFPRSSRTKERKKKGSIRERSSSSARQARPLACASAMERYVIVSRAALAPSSGVGGPARAERRAGIHSSPRPPFSISYFQQLKLLSFFFSSPSRPPSNNTLAATASSGRSA